MANADSVEDIANEDDMAMHDIAMREYATGETVDHDMIDWD